MSGQQDNRSIPFTLGESYLFGALFPASLAYVLTRVILVTPAILDDWFLVIWLMAVAIACAWVGTKRPISIAALLSGGLAGWISAVSAYQRVVGFGLVDFLIGAEPRRKALRR